MAAYDKSDIERRMEGAVEAMDQALNDIGVNNRTGVVQ